MNLSNLLFEWSFKFTIREDKSNVGVPVFFDRIRFQIFNRLDPTFVNSSIIKSLFFLNVVKKTESVLTKSVSTFLLLKISEVFYCMTIVKNLIIVGCNADPAQKAGFDRIRIRNIVYKQPGVDLYQRWLKYWVDQWHNRSLTNSDSAL